MLTAPLDALTRRSIAGLITGYQRYLSPHKGFACAHRVWHRGESCSQYVKRVVVEQGFSAALPLVRLRFNDCKAANELLRQRRRNLSRSSALLCTDRPAAEEPPKDGTQQCLSNCSNCGPIDCNVAACRGVDCGGMGCSAMDCGGMDCGGMDCGGMDCGGADISGCADCGSCSW